MNRLFTKLGVVLMALSVVGLTALSSCRKKGDTIAKIKVVDTSGSPFKGAMVRLYPTPTNTGQSQGEVNIDDTLYTDATGYAIFDYTDDFNLGQAGYTVLDIEVRSGDSLAGDGVISVEAEKTSEEVVVIQK